VLWDLDTVEFGETVSLVYRLHLRSNAGESLNISTDMVWLGCNGYPHSTLEGAPVGLETASIEVQDRLPADLAATPAPGVVVAAPASDSDDDGGLPLWLLLLCPLLLLALLAFLWWKRRQSPTRPAARARPTVRPDRRTLPDLEDARGRRPNGDDVKHGLTSRSITDQLGRELTMRSPTPGVVQRNLQAGQNATMHVWIEDEKNNELGRATLTLEIIQQTDPLTGRTDHWRQARIDDPSAFVKMDQQSGVGMLILQELERLAQQHQAREIYGKSARPDARSFFKGYKVRRNRLGESELFKPFS